MTTDRSREAPAAPRPQGEGYAPLCRPLPLLATLVALAILALALSACEAGSAGVTAPSIVAIGATEAPAYADANLTLYSSRTPVPFPVRKPTSAELGALKAGAAPYPHAPYLLDSDESVEVNYTITNLDNQTHDVWLLVDPWNEFVRYRPGVSVVSADQTTPNLSGIQQPFVLAPLERLQGNISAQDMSTLALKLDTAMQIMATTLPMGAAYGQSTLLNHDFDIQNAPGPADPLLASYTPKVVAGLTGFDLGLQSAEPMNVAIEATVDVVDASGAGKVVAPGSPTSALIGPPPAVLKVPGSR